MSTIVVEKYKGIITNIKQLFRELYIFNDNNSEKVFICELDRLLSNLENYTEKQILENISLIISELHDEHTVLKIKKMPEFFFPICLNWHDDKMLMMKDDGQYPINSINNDSVEEILALYYAKENDLKKSIIKLLILKDITFSRNIFNKNNLRIDYEKNNMNYTIYLNRQRLECLKSEGKNIDKEEKINYFEIKRISNDTLYLKVRTFFKKNITAEIEMSLKNISNFQNIIIDIRNNPGGYIDEAKQFLSLFLEKTIRLPYKILKKNGDSYFLLEQNIIGRNCYKNVKVIILINEFTMSSSEYVIALGAKYFVKNSILIGEKTAGISDQALIFPLDEKIDFQLTVSKYIELDNSIKEGIEPDIYMKKINIESLVDYIKLI